MALNSSHRSATWRGSRSSSSSVRRYSEFLLHNAHIRAAPVRFKTSEPDSGALEEALAAPKPKGTAPKDNLVKFRVHKPTVFGEVVKAIGSSMVFGGWAVESALPLSWTPEGWVGEVRLPPGAYEFKAIVCDEASGRVDWEGGSNRLLEVPAFPGVLDVEHTWDAPSLITRFTDLAPSALDPIELAAQRAAATRRADVSELAEAAEEMAEATGAKLAEARQAVLSDIKRLMDEDRPTLTPELVSPDTNKPTDSAVQATVTTPTAAVTAPATPPTTTAAPAAVAPPTVLASSAQAVAASPEAAAAVPVAATPAAVAPAAELPAAEALPLAVQLVEDAAAVAAILSTPPAPTDTAPAAPPATATDEAAAKAVPAAAPPAAPTALPHVTGSVDSADVTVDEPAVAMTMANFHTMSPAMDVHPALPVTPPPPPPKSPTPTTTPTPPSSPAATESAAVAEAKRAPVAASAVAAEPAGDKVQAAPVQASSVPAQANNVLPAPPGMSEGSIAPPASADGGAKTAESSAPAAASGAESPARRALSDLWSFLANGGRKR